MKRRFLIILFIALLLSAVIGMWGRSYKWVDIFQVHTPWGGFGLTSDTGGLYMELYGTHYNDLFFARAIPQFMTDDIYVPHYYPRDSGQFLGFAFGKKQPAGALANWVVIPDWFIAGVVFIYSIWFLKRKRIFAQSSSIVCSVCGYDLRATKDKCPECGTAIPAKPL